MELVDIFLVVAEVEHLLELILEELVVEELVETKQLLVLLEHQTLEAVVEVVDQTMVQVQVVVADMLLLKLLLYNNNLEFGITEHNTQLKQVIIWSRHVSC
jgi:hypothetical protein